MDLESRNNNVAVLMWTRVRCVFGCDCDSNASLMITPIDITALDDVEDGIRIEHNSHGARYAAISSRKIRLGSFPTVLHHC